MEDGFWAGDGETKPNLPGWEQWPSDSSLPSPLSSRPLSTGCSLEPGCWMPGYLRRLKSRCEARIGLSAHRELPRLLQAGGGSCHGPIATLPAAGSVGSAGPCSGLRVRSHELPDPGSQSHPKNRRGGHRQGPLCPHLPPPAPSSVGQGHLWFPRPRAAAGHPLQPLLKHACMHSAALRTAP